MRIGAKGTSLILAMLLTVTACADEERGDKSTSTVQPKRSDTQARITRVYADLAKDAGWWIVPKGVSEMTVHAEVSNAETVLFWLVPGGTQTWSERKLIGYDADGSDGWSLKWEFGDRSFHDYIYVQALGSDGLTQANETIRITSAVP